MKLVIAIALFMAGVAAGANPQQGAIDAALANPARPAADRERDAARKPGEVLAWRRSIAG